MKTQVNKEHYYFENYMNISRWSSYFYQIKEASESEINSVLLIGVGDKIVPKILKEILKLDVTTFDFDKSLEPDICGDIVEIESILNKKYDCIVCCEVLEHIPFEYFEMVLRQFKNIATNKIIISLPCNYKNLIHANTHIPKLRYKINIGIKRFWIKKWRKDIEGNGEHYYEVGVKDITKKKIRNIMEKYFVLEREYIPIENTYHIFYVLRNK